MREQAPPYWRIRPRTATAPLADDKERLAVITFLGTIIFAVIIGIGSLDGRSGLALLGKYTTPGTVGRRARPGPGGRRGDGPAPR